MPAQFCDRATTTKKLSADSSRPRHLRFAHIRMRESFCVFEDRCSDYRRKTCPRPSGFCEVPGVDFMGLRFAINLKLGGSVPKQLGRPAIRDRSRGSQQNKSDRRETGAEFIGGRPDKCSQVPDALDKFAIEGRLVHHVAPSPGYATGNTRISSRAAHPPSSPTTTQTRIGA